MYVYVCVPLMLLLLIIYLYVTMYVFVHALAYPIGCEVCCMSQYGIIEQNKKIGG